jgi:Protein of unknown function (DUF2778)
MPYSYEQSTGILRYGAMYVDRGYAGHPPHVNDSEAQNIPNAGPLPCGLYDIGDAYLDPEKGPLTMRLTPHPENEMFGRSGFMIHGDEVGNPGKQLASDGCMIFAYATRLAIDSVLDKLLQVIP